MVRTCLVHPWPEFILHVLCTGLKFKWKTGKVLHLELSRYMVVKS